MSIPWYVWYIGFGLLYLAAADVRRRLRKRPTDPFQDIRKGLVEKGHLQMEKYASGQVACVPKTIWGRTMMEGIEDTKKLEQNGGVLYAILFVCAAIGTIMTWPWFLGKNVAKAIKK